MKVNPFAPRLLIDYDLYCRRHGHIDFGTFMCHWYAAEALAEAAEAEALTPEEMGELADQLFPPPPIN